MLCVCNRVVLVEHSGFYYDTNMSTVLCSFIADTCMQHATDIRDCIVGHCCGVDGRLAWIVFLLR